MSKHVHSSATDHSMTRIFPGRKMRFAKASFIAFLMATLYSNVGLCQQASVERVIRVLGVVPLQEADLVPLTPPHLAAILQAWNNTGLPALAGVAVEVVNGGIAQVASQAIVITDPTGAGLIAIQSNEEVKRLRGIFSADVVIVFTRQVSVAVANGNIAGGAAVTPGDFVQGSTGLDLRRRDSGYVALVDPTFERFTGSAHEFGHIHGGGHFIAGGRLYPDCAAQVTPFRFGTIPLTFDDMTITVPDRRKPTKFFATAITSPGDDLGKTTDSVIPTGAYSSLIGGKVNGDLDHNNARCLTTFALSVANYFLPSSPPTTPQLFPPVNLRGNFVRCEGSLEIYDIFWDNDPRTTAAVDRYGLYTLDANDSVYKFEYFSNTNSTNAALVGAASRVKVNACSANACSALSLEFFEATQRCNNN